MVRWGAKLLLAAALLLAGLILPLRAAAGAPPPAVRSLPGSGMMCLTFDDGFGPEHILRVLDCLRARKVRCTFFVIGRCLAAYPDLWRQAAADGHEIAYHSMYHTPLGGASRAAILDDVAQWNALARDVLGADYRVPKLARLPFGISHQDPRILGIFHEMGYTIVGWNADTYSGVAPGSGILLRTEQYVLSRAAEGTILLQHFTYVDSMALTRFIDPLMERVSLGTVSEAMAAQAARQSLEQKRFARAYRLPPTASPFARRQMMAGPS